MHGKVEICGVNTAKLRVLKSAEMTELLRRVKAGDQQARAEMVEGNLRLVLSVIQRFSGRGENMDDLFQVGCIGLLKAIDRFDCDQFEVKFSTYGVPLILGEVRRFLRDSSSVRVSRSIRDTAYHILQTREQFARDHQREPTMDEIAELMNLKREEVVIALEAVSDPVSLYEPVYSDSGDTVCVMDQVKDERNTDQRWLEQIALRDALDRLNDRERRIIQLRFFQGKTQMEVSREVGISQAQVSRLEKGAIEQMRRHIS